MRTLILNLILELGSIKNHHQKTKREHRLLKNIIRNKKGLAINKKLNPNILMEDMVNIKIRDIITVLELELIDFKKLNILTKIPNIITLLKQRETLIIRKDKKDLMRKTKRKRNRDRELISEIKDKDTKKGMTKVKNR